MILEHERYIVTFGNGKQITALGSFLKSMLREGCNIASWQEVTK